MSCVRRVVVCVTASVLLSASACATVQPWEREAHARRGMQVEPDPATAALDQHVYEYREGASGGYGQSSGSGCGCN